MATTNLIYDKTTERPSLLLAATFTAYDYSEQVQLELPANFWQMNSADRAELLDDEYDNWLEGGRRQWCIESEEPEQVAD